MADPDRDQRDDRNPWAQVARYSEIGFIIPAAVLLGWIVGAIVDHYAHTRWGAIVGVIFGAIVGFVQMIRGVLRMDSKP